MKRIEPIRLVEVNEHLEDSQGKTIERSELIVILKIKNDGIDENGNRIVWTDEKVQDSVRKNGARYYSKDRHGNYTLSVPR